MVLGNLVITYTGNGSAEGDINGFQIQAAPFTINASSNNTNVIISFLTQSGFSYQVEYKNNLTDANWIPWAVLSPAIMRFSRLAIWPAGAAASTVCKYQPMQRLL